MVQNNSSNQDFTNNTDGFALGGGTTERILTVTGGNVTLTGGNASVYTLPASTDTLVGRASVDTLTNKTISGATVSDATNVVLGTTTGTQFGTATTQKIGFYGTAPVAQQAATTDIGTVLSTLGLRASGTAYPITTSGAVSLTGTTNTLSGFTITDATNLTLGTTTGTKIGTATTQKVGFYGTAPVAQQTATTEIGTSLANLGLRASGSTYSISTSGAVTLSGNLVSSASFAAGFTTITAATTLTTSSPPIILCNSSTAFNLTLTGASASNYSYVYTIKNIGTATVTVVGTIDGATNFSLLGTGSPVMKYVTVASSATTGTWYILASN